MSEITIVENPTLLKRSIFKQQTYAKRYQVAKGKDYYSGWGLITSIKYDIKQTDTKEFISEENIIEINIPMPLLEIGDRFYIEEKKMLVKITGAYRTSMDAVIYYIEPILVEDKDTKESLDRCINEITENDHLKKRVIELSNRASDMSWNKDKLEEIQAKWYYKLFNK